MPQSVSPKLQTFSAGEVLFREGEPGDRVFFIMQGRVKVHQTHSDGHEQELAQLGDSDIVGEMAVLDERPRSATVTALEDTDVMVVEKANFLASMEQQPQLAIRFLKLLSERIHRLNDKFRDALDLPG
ncbi:MAG: cyclic nucleotide-binding domain-containing protein [Candidatus Sericytochromatia bacterium]|nr:cyclic nucleotide-binding domain-containing protein [Candidatus Sericytochromatia bacterium]